MGAMEIKRRPHGSLVGGRKVGLWLEAEADAHLTALSNSVGTTRSAVVQWLIESASLDDKGKLAGWKENPPHEEELPLDT